MAELKLKVSLDTSYLKGQISRLPFEFAGANVSIRPKFDRQTIVNEFRLLNRYISSKKFNIVITTNLKAEIENADRLVKALGRVQQAASGAKGGLPIGTQALSRTKSQRGFAAAEIKALFGAAVQGGLIDEKTLAATRAQMVAALGSIGRDSIAGLLNGLKSGDADIQNAAKFLGNNLIASFKTVLGIASPSREFKKIGESAGQGFEQGLLKSIEIAEQSATRKMQRMLDRLARMALMMGGISGPEIGRQVAQARALPSLNFGATTPRTSVGIGPSSTGRVLPPGTSRPELPGTAFGRQKYLPTALGEELKEVLRGAANAFLDSIRQNIRTVTVSDMGAPPSRQGLLQGGSVAGLLPGRASAASVLELNNILAGAIREYFKSVAREIKYKSNAIGKTPISTTPLLAQSRVAGLLPQSVGRTPSVYRSGPRESQEQLFARRTREAYINSAARAADIRQSPLALPPGMGLGQPSMMRAPSVPPSMGGGGAPPVPPRGGGGGSFGGGGFNVPNLPGAGLVREIGTEFGFAAKQVLLFGTAYKALAFIQGFPAQVGDAVGALQSFRNTLGAISPSAEEAAESSQFILDVVDKYNTPIQSARDGFTKLYASMKPTGFSGDEIRDLFLGISQAAATFGMSAEKVDRVNYAFAQMASKGQVMSEELKGQLGDVLPGAMGIFAEAAGFEGPDAITKFSKALEDGAYKGAAMKTLLVNVTSIMKKEFGPGAEGAARTFQGVMNRMQNSAKLLYEAFEPVAVGFLNSVVMPLTSGLKTVTDGFNAFFTGANAKTAGGFAFAQELEKLRPTFEGLRANAIGLAQVFGEFAKVALGVSSALLQIAGNPIVGYMAKIYAIIVPLNMALGVMRGLWALNSLQLLLFNARVAMGVPTLSAFRGMMQATGATAAVTATSIRTAGLTLRTFFASTGVGLILVGISLLIERFMSMNQTLADTRAKALSAAEAIRAMSGTQARQVEQQAASDLVVLRKLQSKPNKGQTNVPVTTEEKEALSRAGIEGGISVLGQRAVPGATLPKLAQSIGLGYGTNVADQSEVVGAIQRREAVLSEAKHRQRVLKSEEAESKKTATIAPITGVAGDGKGAGKGANKLDTYNRSTLDFIQQQGELEQQSLDRKRQQNLLSETQYKIESASLTLDVVKREEAEKLRLATLATNKDNLSAGDKALKIADLQISYQNNLAIAQDKYTTAVEGAKKELEGPFNDAIDKANFSIMEQEMLLQNIQNGIQELAPDQQAYLQVLGLTEGKSEDELAILEKISMVLRDRIEKQIALNKEVERGRILLGLNNQLALARILDPKLELREQIGQRDTSLTAGQIEQEALLQEQVNAAQKIKEQLQGIASSIGNSFGEAFKGIITGSMTVQQALAGMFQSIADSFADMAAQMIAEYVRMQALGLLKTIFSAVAPALGAGIGAGLSSGFSAGTSSAIDTGAGGWANSFGTSLQFANGGVASGGFTAFANGGMVTGPTLGLVGEGRYNEAIIPLPDGKSVPVQLSGGAGGNAAPINTNIVVNVKNGQAESQTSGSQGNQLARELEGAVRQVILKESRPGGLISSSR